MKNKVIIGIIGVVVVLAVLGGDDDGNESTTSNYDTTSATSTTIGEGGTEGLDTNVNQVTMQEREPLTDEEIYNYLQQGYRVDVNGTLTGFSDEFVADAQKNMSQLEIPNGVTKIGCDIGQLDGLAQEMKYRGGREWVDENGNVIPPEGSRLTSVIIPESVTEIGNYAFEECIHLTSINIPEGVTTIGYSAFAECSSLTSINIPEGVTVIESYTFRGCSSLTSVNIPEGVTTIKGAFERCINLAELYIPESVTTIEGGLFGYPSEVEGEENQPTNITVTTPSYTVATYCQENGIDHVLQK